MENHIKQLKYGVYNKGVKKAATATTSQNIDKTKRKSEKKKYQ